MSKTSRNLRIDRDGVRVFETTGAKRIDIRLVLAVVAAIAVGIAAFWLRPTPQSSALQSRVAQGQPEPISQPEVVQMAQAEIPVRPNRNVRAVHVAGGAAPSGQAAGSEAPDDNKDQPDIDARDVILALQASGEKEGIAAFNPPGTNPPKSGIIVPEDYQLPEGYVRHYQVTDDGQRLDAILMFSPDYQFVDPNGNPISTPEDLIVPPELAPPGLPIRMLEVPKRRLR